MRRRAISNTLEVEHKGHKIYYRDDDTWQCPDFQFEAPKLSTIKAKIDAVGKSDRTVNVPAILLGSNYYDNSLTIQQGTVTVLCDPSTSRWSKPETTECWFVTDKGERSKVNISALVKLEAQAQCAAVAEINQRLAAVKKEYEAAMKKLPRHTAESLLKAKS